MSHQKKTKNLAVPPPYSEEVQEPLPPKFIMLEVKQNKIPTILMGK